MINLNEDRWKPEQGEMILVKNNSIPKGTWHEREFVWVNKLLYWCVVDNEPERLAEWLYAKPMPKEKYIDFTVETFPKGVVFIRRKGESGRRLVIDVLIAGVTLSDGEEEYETLHNIYEISLDGGETWQVAGLEVDVG